MLDSLFVANALKSGIDSAHDLGAAVASGAAGQAQSRDRELGLDVEKLFMITEALWNVLKKQHGYEDEELVRMIQDIDLRDGRLDGKVAKTPNPPCSGCGRTLSSRHTVCLYCGVVANRDPFER